MLSITFSSPDASPLPLLLVGILILFFLLASRGYRASLGTPDTFGKLLAAGMASIMVIQLFVVVGGVTILYGLRLLASWVATQEAALPEPQE